MKPGSWKLSLEFWPGDPEQDAGPVNLSMCGQTFGEVTEAEQIFADMCYLLRALHGTAQIIGPRLGSSQDFVVRVQEILGPIYSDPDRDGDRRPENNR